MSRKDDLFNKKHLTQHDEILSMLKSTDRKQKKNIDIRVLLSNKYFLALLAADLHSKEIIDCNDENSITAFRNEYSEVTPQNSTHILHFLQKISGQEIYDEPVQDLNITEAIAYMESIKGSK